MHQAAATEESSEEEESEDDDDEEVPAAKPAAAKAGSSSVLRLSEMLLDLMFEIICCQLESGLLSCMPAASVTGRYRRLKIWFALHTFVLLLSCT